MPDLLETRLHADAAGDDTSAPDLDALLTPIMSQRRRPRAWLPIAAAAAAVLAAAALALPVSPVNLLPGDHPRTVASTIAGVTVEPDARSLVVFLVFPATATCLRDGPHELTARQTGDEIHLSPPRFSIATPTRRGGPDHEGDPACEVGSYTARVVLLSRPLAGRVVVDDSDGVALPVLDAKSVLERPTYLPAGFKPVPSQSCTGPTCRLAYAEWLADVYASDLQPPTAGVVYSASDDGGAYVDDRSLSVDVGRSTRRLPTELRVVGHTKVGTRTAAILEDPRQRSRCLLWSPGPGLAVQVCSDVPYRPNGANRAPQLPTSELVRVAESVRRVSG